MKAAPTIGRTTRSRGHCHVAAPPAVGAARFVEMSCNRKLAPVENGFRGLKAVGPFVLVADVAISSACSDACAFKAGGCFDLAGTTKRFATAMDAAAGEFSREEVIAEEVRLIDMSFRGGRIPQDGGRDGRHGRDLRLHVGGDVDSASGAHLPGAATNRWVSRGGGRVWTFTHLWREIPRAAFDAITVLASVEHAEDIEVARARGYAAAIVVAEFPAPKAFALPGSDAKIVPCPAETLKRTCVECRLCLDANKLLDLNVSIAFEAHGPASKMVAQALVQPRANGREL